MSRQPPIDSLGSRPSKEIEIRYSQPSPCVCSLVNNNDSGVGSGSGSGVGSGSGSGLGSGVGSGSGSGLGSAETDSPTLSAVDCPESPAQAASTTASASTGEKILASDIMATP